MACAERDIPLILVNGRRVGALVHALAARCRGTIGALLRRFDLCLAQSAAMPNATRELGAPRIATTGNLKLDVPAPPADAGKLAAISAAIGERP